MNLHHLLTTALIVATAAVFGRPSKVRRVAAVQQPR